MSRSPLTRVCVVDLTPRPDTTSACPLRDKHTPSPTGYLAWGEWADKKSRTHVQVRCTGCGRLAIWVTRTSPRGREAAYEAAVESLEGGRG